MTVGEAIKELQRHPAEDELFVASNAEGNSFHRVNAIEIIEGDASYGLVVLPRHAMVDFDE
jgi:hypothetical protein